MHPMFVKLFLETGADDLQADEPDSRRPANRACRRRRSPRAGVGYVRRSTTSSRRSPSGKTWRWSATCWRDAR